MPSGGLPMDVEYEAANLAIRYLRKMAQWNKGLIDLAVPGTDPPARMTDEEIVESLNRMLLLRDRS